ncbi:MAG: hypothetical protein IJ011_01115 [Clostridia bacterium]|nr:hypothetical protein [Clostridia bacterium]
MRKKRVKDTENTNNGVKFRALDVVIIILILTAVAGVYFRYNILDMLTGNKNLKDYVVSFEISDILYSTENYINVGDKVYYNNDSGEELGTLIEASEDAKNALIVVPAIKNFIPDGENRAVEVSYPVNTRIDASGRMKCRGTYSEDGGFLVGGTDYLAAGDKIAVKTDLVTVEITVTNIVAAE